MKRFATALAFGLALAGPAALSSAQAATTEPPTCDDPGVQRVLGRINNGAEVDSAHEMGSNQGKRWCAAALISMRTQYNEPWWGLQVVYTVEFTNPQEGRYWVQTQSSDKCWFTDTQSGRANIAFGYRDCRK
jgi:hypothetical protein